MARVRVSVKAPAADDGQLWALGVTQPPPLMVKVVADRIAKDGVKKLAYIGYSEAWRDFVYNGAKAAEKADGLQVVTNERYARTVPGSLPPTAGHPHPAVTQHPPDGN